MYRALLLPVYLPSFLMSVCQGAALLLIPLYALDLGGSPAVAAIIFACRGLGNMLADVPAGLAAEKFGDARVMQAGVALMILAATGCAFASDLLQLGLFSLIIGLSMATWLLARLTLISDLVAVNFRGQALSTMAGLQRFGSFHRPSFNRLYRVRIWLYHRFYADCGTGRRNLLFTDDPRDAWREGRRTITTGAHLNN